VPLRFAIIDSLPRAPDDNAPRTRPADVAETDICWPLGLPPQDDAPELCQRRMKAWALDGVIPPTFAERDARRWSTGVETFAVDAKTGLRLSAECAGPHASQTRRIARWPALASPWLDARTRAQSRLPPLSPDCRDDGRAASEELRIDGIKNRTTLARAPGSTHGARLQLRALGTENGVQWLLDGKWIAQTQGARAFVRDFDEPGQHTLTALADSGAWTQVEFWVLR
jgi:penicillin-binding protein 1C